MLFLMWSTVVFFLPFAETAPAGCPWGLLRYDFTECRISQSLSKKSTSRLSPHHNMILPSLLPDDAARGNVFGWALSTSMDRMDAHESRAYVPCDRVKSCTGGICRSRHIWIGATARGANGR